MRKWFLFHAILLFAGLSFCSAQAYEALNGPSQLIKYKSREFGDLFIIDHKTGDILYRWGNPSTYGAGAPPTFTTPGDQILFGPHDAHWIEDGHPGAGNILIFNNGWARPPVTYSSVIEMDP